MALDAAGGLRKWEKGWATWMEKAHQRHNNYFTYPDMNRIGSPQDGWRIRIVCPEHGEFLQAPNKHMFGQGCPKCSGLGLDKVTQLKAKYPNWNWDGVVVTHSKKPITLTCPEHGEFKTLFNRLMNKEDHVPPCPQCARDQGGVARRKTMEHWTARIQERHGDRYTVVVDAATWYSDITLLCKEHGEFTVKLGDVVEKGSGCPSCGAEARKKWQDDVKKVKPEDVLAKSRLIHGDRYEYNMDTLDGCASEILITCKEHGDFWQIARNHYVNGAGCPKCVAATSKAETEIGDYLEGLGHAVERSNRTLIKPLELDVYLPEFKLGIEYCGLYWHGENNKDKEYHKVKYEKAVAAGIDLITVFEDEWLENSEKVKARIRARLGLCKEVPVHETTLSEITWAQAKEFLVEFDLKGPGNPASYCLGLSHEGKLIAVTTWGKSRYEEGYIEMYRSCSADARVVGGLSMMVKKALGRGESLLAYSDLRWSNGDGYSEAGFTFVGNTLPNYFWCKASSRWNRQQFQKHKLAEILKEFDETLTEAENCHRNGLFRVYDCGNSKWILKA